MIPLIDEMAACHVANYRFYDDWQTLSSSQKSTLVAHFYVSRLVDTHKEDAAATDAERKSKKK